jgi:hypothetical protein
LFVEILYRVWILFGYAATSIVISFVFCTICALDFVLYDTPIFLYTIGRNAWLLYVSFLIYAWFSIFFSIVLNYANHVWLLCIIGKFSNGVLY